MSYKVNGISNLATKFRFTGKNDDFLLDSFAESQVFLHTIEIDGRLTVMIEVGQDTTARQIRRVISYALDLRDRLLEFQGAWIGGGPNAFYERLSQLQEHGMTYIDIARRLKSQVEESLREAVAFDDEFRKVLPTLKTHGDYLMWAYGEDGIYKQHSPESLNHAKYILELIGSKDNLDDKEIEAWLKEGIANLRAGKEPFNQNPFTRKRIIEVIRAWRKGKKHNSIRARKKKVKAEKDIR